MEIWWRLGGDVKWRLSGDKWEIVSTQLHLKEMAINVEFRWRSSGDRMEIEWRSSGFQWEE